MLEVESGPCCPHYRARLKPYRDEAEDPKGTKGVRARDNVYSRRPLARRKHPTSQPSSSGEIRYRHRRGTKRLVISDTGGGCLIEREVSGVVGKRWREATRGGSLDRKKRRRRESRLGQVDESFVTITALKRY